MSAHSSTDRAAVVIAMVDNLTPLTRGQVARALHGELNQHPAAGKQRLRELLPLALMLDEQARREGITPAYGGRGAWLPELAGRWERFPVVAQVDYDRQRPPEAPTGEQLTRRFGTWIEACRAVYGLKPDGRYAGMSRPWVNGSRGQKRPRKYTRQEALAAIRQCALAYGRRPTSNLYIEWSARRRAHARATGSPPPRLPAYKYYHDNFGGWPKALALAAISDFELAQARAARNEPGPEIPEEHTPAGRLRAADADELVAAGFRPDDVATMLKRGFGSLELSGRQASPGY